MDYTASEMIGKSILNVIPDDRKDEFQTYNEKIELCGEKIEHHGHYSDFVKTVAALMLMLRLHYQK